MNTKTKYLAGFFAIFMIVLMAGSVLAVAPIGSIFDTDAGREAGTYNLQLVSASITSPSPGKIKSVITIRNTGTLPLSGILSVEGLNDYERNALPENLGREGFYGGVFYCENPEDVQIAFSLNAGESDTVTLYGDIGTAGYYPIHVITATDCYKDGGTSLYEAYSGYQEIGFGYQTTLYVEGTNIECSGGFSVGERTCSTSNTDYVYICGSDGQWDYISCATGSECEIISSDYATCTSQCTDTCYSEGFECGYQTICGQSQYCGGCDWGLTCSNGQCTPESEQYDLRVTSKQAYSPEPGVIKGTYTLKNFGTQPISGLFSMEVCTDTENNLYNCDGRSATPRAGFTTNEVCQNSEDPQAWFTLAPGESDTRTLTSVIGTGDNYPIVLGVSDKCYKDGGIPLQAKFPGNYEGFGYFKEVAVSEPSQTITCSGDAPVGEYKCLPDLSGHEVCLATGQWQTIICEPGFQCEVSAGSVCKPYSVACNNNGICDPGETITTCSTDCDEVVGEGNVVFKVLSHQKVSDGYEATFEVINNYDKQILGLGTLELITPGEEAGTFDRQSLVDGNLVNCQRPEDAQVRILLNPGSRGTYTLKANPLSGQEYTDVVFGVAPDCYNTMPVALASVGWLKVFDYGLWQDVGTIGYPAEQLVVVDDQTSLSLKTCIDCPFTIAVDYTEYTNRCWAGMEPGDSKCEASTTRYECQCFPESQECRMITNGCGANNCVMPDPNVNLAVCEVPEDTEFVCVRSQKTVSEITIELDDVLGDIQGIGETVSGVSAGLSFFTKPFTELFGMDIDERSAELEENLVRIQTSRDVMQYMKQVDGYYWGWISQEQYQASSDIWFIQDMTKDECVNNRDETKAQIEDAIALYNETTSGDSIVAYTPNADPNELAKMTTRNKISHSCIDSRECAEGGKCYPLSYIVSEGWLTKLDAENYMVEVQASVVSLDLGPLEEGAISAIASGVCIVAATASSVVSAGGTLALIPICGGAGVLTWAGLDWLQGANAGDMDKFGMCIEEEKAGFFNTLKNTIADAFNIDPSSQTVTYILIGFAIFIAFMIYLMVKPPGPRG